MMAKLENLRQGAKVKGINPSGAVTVINITWFGSEVVELTYSDQDGQHWPLDVHNASHERCDKRGLKTLQDGN